MKERKYFFDLNNFDEPEVIEIEMEAPPPPPSFSLDDIGSAKEVSFEDGRMAGLAEAETLRAQYIAEQLNHIEQQARLLIEAEQFRNAHYERDVLHLVHTIMEHSFPHLTKTHAINDIKAMITDVLAREIKSPHIVIETPIDDAEDIQNFMDSLKFEQEAAITVRADPSLNAGNCRIMWRDGGAVRDHTALTHEILRQLKPQTGQQTSQQAGQISKVHPDTPRIAPAKIAKPKKPNDDTGLAPNGENDHNANSELKGDE